MNNRIKEIRNKEKLTLRELSQKIGIASNTLSQYETGKREPKLEMWQALAKSLSVPVPYLQGLGVSRSEAINDIVDKLIDKKEYDTFTSFRVRIRYDLQEKLTRSDVNYINSTWGSGLSSSNNLVESLINNNNRQALGYLVGKYLPLVNDYNFLASVPDNVNDYYKALEEKYNHDNNPFIFSESDTDKPKNKDVVLFESICDLFISDIGVKSSLLSYSDDRKIEINKKVRSLFNLLTTDTDDKRVLEIRENVKDQLDAYANDNED
ncbi:helix-turn-helix transcriptional regulator [Ligilactobacillus salivarius]|nr:helix-turn-helix transcriptional regulator [Ligilactobacillus salivarius]